MNPVFEQIMQFAFIDELTKIAENMDNPDIPESGADAYSDDSKYVNPTMGTYQSVYDTNQRNWVYKTASPSEVIKPGGMHDLQKAVIAGESMKEHEKEPVGINSARVPRNAVDCKMIKVALKNYVAEYGIKGSTMGAGVGAAAAGLATHRILKAMKNKNPIIAASMAAGAMAGAAAGGRMGAFMGGGEKGTHNLFAEQKH